MPSANVSSDRISGTRISDGQRAIADRVVRRAVTPATDWWERLYRSSDVRQLPWYSPELDQDVEGALAVHMTRPAKVLDLGTGPGTQAVQLAKRGHEVVATDISETAVKRARALAKDAGVKIDVRVDNILDSKLEDALVGVIMDRGAFHVLPPEARPVYVRQVRRILRPGGLLLLKTFSDKEPGDEGPYRLSPGELRAYFRDGFDVVSIEDTVFGGTLRHAPHALFAVFRRR